MKAENAYEVDDQTKAAEAISIDKKNDNKIEHDTLKDEFCSDETFEEKTSSPLDKEVIGNLVDKIFVKHSEVHQMRDDTEKVIEKKLLSVGIEAEKIESVKVEQGKSKVVVKIKPIDKKKVDAAEYPLCVVGWHIDWM